ARDEGHGLRSSGRRAGFALRGKGGRRGVREAPVALGSLGINRMKLAWFTHRFHPCVGGAETYGRAMIRRFVAAGHKVDVFTSDAQELAYFVDRRRRRVDAPAESVVDGARVRRFAARHVPLQRYIGKLLGYAPHWPTRCRRAAYMPILPGIE